MKRNRHKRKNKVSIIWIMVTVYLSLAGEVTFSNQTSWKEGEQENVPYTLSWTDSMISPSLATEDKVRVSVQAVKRGNLLDRNGNIFSGEGTASSVGLVPGKHPKEIRCSMGKSHPLSSPVYRFCIPGRGNQALPYLSGKCGYVVDKTKEILDTWFRHGE